MGNPRELSRQTLAEGRFLHFQLIRWQDVHGKERLWECAGRKADQQAVMLIAWLKQSDRLVLVRQFRPPAQGFVIEFPAGLVDPGEPAETTALRELHEETGYHGKILRVYPPSYNTPGLSGESTWTVLLEIDESLPENRNPAPNPDEGEQIEVILVGRAELPGFVDRELAAGSRFDSKVMAYITALATAASMP